MLQLDQHMESQFVVFIIYEQTTRVIKGVRYWGYFWNYKDFFLLLLTILYFD